tara:strand:+ start:3131 stop:3748 length:618 start_codon:yes stop_codon:yes gene_type:complete
LALRTTLREERQKKASFVAKSVLKEKYTYLELKDKVVVEEDMNSKYTTVACTVTISTSENTEDFKIDGHGHGPVDAFFSSLKSTLVKKFKSLDGLAFQEFAISADIGRFSQNHSGSNSPVEAVLVVRNDREEDLIFRNKSRSTNKAALSVVLSAIEHFINSEKAVIILSECIKDAERRNRGDLVEVFTRQLIELVKNNSYERILK